MSVKIETVLRELVRHAAPGVTVYFPRKRIYRAGYSWNGKHLRPTGETLESQIHEIAHLLVAPEERRTMPEFGLGPDPYRRQFVPRLVPQEEADREELDACALQLILVRMLGLDESAVVAEVKVELLTEECVRALRAWRPRARADAGG
ncbi:MAG: hypothetical protein IT378_04570, partial [Sandaracinaceae bacterium]|nr:hypothetical protein [Sandaracinaceae bacterium]